MKTLIACCLFGIWAAAAVQVPSDRISKRPSEVNATKLLPQKKGAFKPTAKPQPVETTYTTPYYPRGTIATH